MLMSGQVQVRLLMFAPTAVVPGDTLSSDAENNADSARCQLLGSVPFPVGLVLLNSGFWPATSGLSRPVALLTAGKTRTF